jgi:hypothetical protein
MPTPPASVKSGAAAVLGDSHYVARKKVMKIFGQAFHVYDSQENVVAFCKMKAFKLREDIRVYTSEDATSELLSIQARQIIDFSAAYDVIDPVARQKVGALQRKGLKSMLKDEWMILDARDREIGLIEEDSMIKAIVRRFVDLAANFMPQKYHATVGGQMVCTFQQNFNPFVQKLAIDFSYDQNKTFDRRLGLAAAILLLAIEGRQA